MKLDEIDEMALLEWLYATAIEIMWWMASVAGFIAIIWLLMFSQAA